MFPLFDHRKSAFYIGLSIAAVLISSQLTHTISYGILFSYLGAVIFVIAMTHKWLKSSSYMLLTIISTGMIIVSILLNNLLGDYYQDTFFDDIKEFFFFLAVFLCPFGIVIGIVGYFLLSGRIEKK